ncbi:MAG TPA: isocitrate lyase/phosphoenolpyruvate mutase family protein, partial [Dehalococcoidia bacterium]|nr:isocitrate lyase/phosphoenolpyruvate mutase family protein [Dehalococcoidia bacterium]
MANPKLRLALENGETVMAPGIYDAATARLMRYLGFEYLYVPGSQTGTVLATTEPLTTLTHMADVGRTVERACRGELPVILDAGAGFGEPIHVMQTVRTLEL